MKKTFTKNHKNSSTILKISLIVVSLFLFICVGTYSVFAKQYNCIPCKENNYCIKGVRYECPVNKPVTQGNRATSEENCLTCVERNGNDANPIYDITLDDCVSCYEYDDTKPYWNGTMCTTCPTETPYWLDGECSECAFKIPHQDSTICITDSLSYTASADINPQSAEDETEEFLTKYNIQYVSSVYPDYWAGAKKYCQDKGARLATMDELLTIANHVYGQNFSCTNSCGEQGGCCDYDNLGLTVANTKLYNFLDESNSPNPFAWSSAESSNAKNSFGRIFYSEDKTIYTPMSRNTEDAGILCVKTYP